LARGRSSRGRRCFVAYAGWLKGLDRRAAWEAAGTALHWVDLAAEAGRRTSQLSSGQQRRVGLAQILVHQAAVLLLDEPTAGLDPDGVVGVVTPRAVAASRQGRCRLNGGPGLTSRAFGSSRCVYSRL
jgi:ABC-type phosphate/phosphonate transport system ATPase subunit